MNPKSRFEPALEFILQLLEVFCGEDKPQKSMQNIYVNLLTMAESSKNQDEKFRMVLKKCSMNPIDFFTKKSMGFLTKNRVK